MNFLPGVVRGGQVVLSDGSLLPMPVQAKAAEGHSVIYGIRPEHLDIGSDSQGLASEVVVVEPTGADTQVFTKIAGVEVTSVFRERHAFTPGSTIRLQADASR
ncbi:MAG: TOBE domain-containing protein, partial [Burkholderiaceae bacterium]|nr:TOBE domain-containing protein [Burkholderiaceae bacterium]